MGSGLAVGHMPQSVRVVARARWHPRRRARRMGGGPGLDETTPAGGSSCFAVLDPAQPALGACSARRAKRLTQSRNGRGGGMWSAVQRPLSLNAEKDLYQGLFRTHATAGQGAFSWAGGLEPPGPGSVTGRPSQPRPSDPRRPAALGRCRPQPGPSCPVTGEAGLSAAGTGRGRRPGPLSGPASRHKARWDGAGADNRLGLPWRGLPQEASGWLARDVIPAAAKSKSRGGAAGWALGQRGQATGAAVSVH